MKNAYEVRGDHAAIFVERKDGITVEVLIDLADVAQVSSIRGRWIAGYHKSIKGYYIMSYVPKTERKGGTAYILLHRFIMGDLPGLIVDHRDRNTLNNRRWNLRIGTQAQNLQNLGISPRNTSGVRGVTWNKEKGKWKARVVIGRREVFNRYFTDLNEAAKAVAQARAELMAFANE